MRKPIFWFRPGGTQTRLYSYRRRLETLDLDSRDFNDLCSVNRGTDQLQGYREADLRLCFRIYAKCWFSHDTAKIIIFCEKFHLNRSRNLLKFLSEIFSPIWQISMRFCPKMSKSLQISPENDPCLRYMQLGYRYVKMCSLW